MNKVMVAAVALGFAAGTPAFASTASGSGASSTTPGYHALVAGDVDRAGQDLAPVAAERTRDPAALLNLGQYYLRTGRLALAREAFESVRDHRRHYLIELANGRVIDTRDAARAALTTVDIRYASR